MQYSSVEAFDSDIQSQEDVIVLFSASWCKMCSHLIQELQKQSISFRKVDVDELSSLADRYDVTNLPKVLFFKNSKLIQSYTGSHINDFMQVYDAAKQGVEIHPTSDTGIEPTIPSIENIDTKNSYLFPVKSISLKDSSISNSLLNDIGLGDLSFTPNEMLQLNHVVSNIFSENSTENDSLSDEQILKLYQYNVPTISQDGTCSNIHQLAKRPFNLSTDAYGLEFSIENLRKNAMTTRLIRLNAIVSKIYELTQADWIGIYRLVVTDGSVPSLMKEAYFGEPSRALFPVTTEFAKKSTNSWVGLTGNCRIIENTRVREEGVAYYECSNKVQSELCVPILRLENDTYQVIGIIDLESWNPCHFTSKRVLEVLKIALDLGQINIGM